MAANIPSSPRTVAMSVYVIRVFVKMREDIAANSAILRRLAAIDKTLLVHDVTLREILQKLRPLLEPRHQHRGPKSASTSKKTPFPIARNAKPSPPDLPLTPNGIPHSTLRT
jgi:hypothetical protein